MRDARDQHGYTMIEMIISISIITIMMGIIVGTYSFGRQYDTLKAETDRVASALRNMRSRAFNGVLFATATYACSLDQNTTCTSNADCSNLNLSVQKGHCTNARYPQFGYGLHIGVDGGADKSTVTYFADLANSDGALPYYDAATEKVDQYTSSVEYIFSAANVTDVEIIFSANDVSVFENAGGLWVPATLSPQGTYVIQIEDFAQGCVKGKRGTVTIDTNTLTMYENFVDC